VSSPSTVELAHGALRAMVHDHLVPLNGTPASCWTVVTDGLADVGQAEVSLTLTRTGAATREFPETLLGYLEAVHQFASEGQTVGEGGLSGYAAPGPFQLGSFVALAFIPSAAANLHIAMPENTIAGVFLTEAEFAMARSASRRRVLHRIGQAYQYFPYPFWSDATRASVYAPGDDARTLLSKFRKYACRDDSAVIEGNTMHVSISPGTADALADTLSAREALALLPGLDRLAVAALVWQPGQTRPEAICSQVGDHPRVAATFVGFVPNDADADSIRFQEDGYTILLTASTTVELVERLRERRVARLDDPDSPHTVIVTSTPAYRGEHGG
jgi:hypothetical protein